MNTPITFKCAQCMGVFESEWTEEEAKAEAKRNGFGTDLENGDCLVCDDCYLSIMDRIGHKIL